MAASANAGTGAIPGAAASPATSPARASHWARLAAPVPPEHLRFRQDGQVATQDGRHAARFVVYLDAGFVRHRLDEVVPGDWELRLFRLPAIDVVDARTGEVKGQTVSFRARLQVLGVVRESIGSGKDYKAAETDAFKRAAARFGIGQDLRALPQIWVPMDGNSNRAKPTKRPLDVYLIKLRSTDAAS